jgi:hypothetical protein
LITGTQGTPGNRERTKLGFWQAKENSNEANAEKQNFEFANAEDGFLSDEFPNRTYETIKARPFLVRKNIFVLLKTV